MKNSYKVSLTKPSKCSNNYSVRRLFYLENNKTLNNFDPVFKEDFQL